MVECAPEKYIHAVAFAVASEYGCAGTTAARIEVENERLLSIQTPFGKSDIDNSFTSTRT